MKAQFTNKNDTNKNDMKTNKQLKHKHNISSNVLNVSDTSVYCYMLS